jgi:hypothetical protein
MSARSVHVMSALVCGLDVHRDSTYVTILDCEGKIVALSARALGFLLAQAVKTGFHSIACSQI